MTSSPPSRPRVARAAAGLLAVLLLAAPAAASAETSLRVSPTRVEADADDGTRLTPISVTNTGTTPIVVDVSTRPSTQGLDGLPVYDENATGEAWRHIDVEPAVLSIQPGGTASVTPTVRGRAGRPGQYGVVLFALRPPGGGSGGGSVTTTVRFAANLLLRFPGALDRRAVVAAARAEQGSEPRTLRFVARLRAFGNIHVRVPALLRVRDASGRVVVRERFTPEVVLPDAAREVPFVLRKVLPAGRYTARVISDVGGRSTRPFAFELAGPNLLPTANLRVVRLGRPTPKPGKPYEVAVSVRNTGTSAVAPVARLSAARPGTTGDAGRKVVTLPEIAPGEAVERKIVMPGVGHGQYELDLRVGDGGRVLDERRVGFEAGATRPWWDRLRDWIAGHLELSLLGALLLVLAALVAGARLGRRRSAVVVMPPPYFAPLNETLRPAAEPPNTPVGAGTDPHS